MATATLPRMLFASGAIADARTQLAKDAYSKLGYSRLARAIALPGALLFALRELDIAPLVSSKVEAYCNKKEKVGMFTGTKIGLMLVTGLLLSITALCCGMNGALHGDSWPGWRYALNIISGLGIGVFTIWNFGHLIEGNEWGHGTRWHQTWRNFALQSYTGTVPEFVLEKALQIKNKCPNATFEIKQLVAGTERREVVRPDPFLIVNLQNSDRTVESYYIDVWDEKEYESKM